MPFAPMVRDNSAAKQLSILCLRPSFLLLSAGQHQPELPLLPHGDSNLWGSATLGSRHHLGQNLQISRYHL